MIELKDDCYARRLEQQNADLLAMLRKLEWCADGGPYCPLCGEHSDDDHAPSCELAALLKEHPKPEGKS